ncbi:glucosamine-6-phosphate deaminase [Bacilli bacterium PM5-9]|nr:glucosamine-6-phosphate deaminase [Bacilli bacterium PM5-9]
MKVFVAENYDELSETSASIIIEDMKAKSNITLGFATGSTPIGTYQNLIAAYNAKEISFKDVLSFNLDEYLGLPRTHEQSYYYFMHNELFNHIDIKEENVNIPNGDIEHIEENIKKYQEMLDSNPIDIQILGIGGNGHIAFNEPGTSFESTTHTVKLDEKTREDNKRFFNDISEVPKEAVTMGIKDIMSAKKLIVLANGESKAKAVKELLEGTKSENFPASILLDHEDVTLIVDKEAASLLKED